MTNNEEVAFITDEDGVWRIDPWGKSLIEPSQEWEDNIKRLAEEEALLEALTPTPQQIADAELEIKILNTLMEVELI